MLYLFVNKYDHFKLFLVNWKEEISHISKAFQFIRSSRALKIISLIINVTYSQGIVVKMLFKFLHNLWILISIHIHSFFCRRTYTEPVFVFGFLKLKYQQVFFHLLVVQLAFSYRETRGDNKKKKYEGRRHLITCNQVFCLQYCFTVLW